MENMIEIKHLHKSFKDVHAVNDLSLRVKKGEFFAFLGINGAGKSTTISIMCGKLKKDEGEVLINGYNIDTDLDKIKSTIGVVFQSSILDKNLSVKDNLEVRASLYGITGEDFKMRLNELSQLLEFKDIINRPFGKLSGGQKRRIDIARALINHPSILILDEPTTGLDPQTRKLVWNVINTLREKEGITVFLTTHYMEETVDADYVVILDSGVIVGEGSPVELKNKYTGDFITFYNVTDDVKDLLTSLGKTFENVPSGIRVSVKNTEEATNLIIEHPEIFKDYEIIKGKMDDVFLNITGKKLTEGDLK
ncbi:MAG: ABC transporter ATP-binding protein [Bacilli bacterium]|nr:ABC transporter ATP-binding protein [Bacilli bacterium]